MSATLALWLILFRSYAQRKNDNGWWLLQFKGPQTELGKLLKGARRALEAAGSFQNAARKAAEVDGRALEEAGRIF